MVYSNLVYLEIYRAADFESQTVPQRRRTRWLARRFDRLMLCAPAALQPDELCLAAALANRQ
jgi:hypothetical protein